MDWLAHCKKHYEQGDDPCAEKHLYAGVVGIALYPPLHQHIRQRPGRIQKPLKKEKEKMKLRENHHPT